MANCDGKCQVSGILLNRKISRTKNY